MAYCQGLPLKYSDMVSAVTACSVCSTHFPRQLPKVSGAVHWSFQQVRDWQSDYIGPSLEVGVKYALVCVDTASSLSQPFFRHSANQAAPIRGSGKLTFIDTLIN